MAWKNIQRNEFHILSQIRQNNTTDFGVVEIRKNLFFFFATAQTIDCIKLLKTKIPKNHIFGATSLSVSIRRIVDLSNIMLANRSKKKKNIRSIRIIKTAYARFIPIVRAVLF